MPDWMNPAEMVANVAEAIARDPRPFLAVVLVIAALLMLAVAVVSWRK
jgi:hypothetical protein